eukprot:1151985-Pelagomonas_calceolata.AAC.7
MHCCPAKTYDVTFLLLFFSPLLLSSPSVALADAGSYSANLITEAQRSDIVQHACPGAGACGETVGKLFGCALAARNPFSSPHLLAQHACPGPVLAARPLTSSSRAWCRRRRRGKRQCQLILHTDVGAWEKGLVADASCKADLCALQESSTANPGGRKLVADRKFEHQLHNKANAVWTKRLKSC